jgi:hypothetical protein
LYCLSVLYYLLGHCIVCPSSIICFAIVLSVPPLLFVWPLYCLSLLYYLFGHCIVCPSSIICLAIVLSFPPLLFLQYNGQTNNRGRTDNTMAKQIIEEGQTIQWPNK